MVKVVYNACFGGFALSRKAAERLIQLGLEDAPKALEEVQAAIKRDDENKTHKSYMGFYYDGFGLKRHDTRLVQVVEELGHQVNGDYADLQIVEIESDRYRIDNYDGNESVETPSDIKWTKV